MTDEQIIKALECCICSTPCNKCLLLGTSDCMNKLMQNAINLINRQKAELSVLCKIINNANEEISELSRKVASRENLEESFLKTTKAFDKKLEKQVKLERREAIKEFAERLKEKCYEYFQETYEMLSPYVTDDDIDNLVKEMTEGKNG